jgi:hypothetical protein
MFLASERFLRNTPGRLRIKFKNDNRDLIVLLEPGGKKIQFFESWKRIYGMVLMVKNFTTVYYLIWTTKL